MSRVSVEDRVAVLTIDHPPANTFNHATLADLDAALDELIANDQVKVIIITGAGEFAFVAGADINEIAAVKDAAQAKEFIFKGRDIRQDQQVSQAGDSRHQRGGAGRWPGAGDGMSHAHPRRSHGWASLTSWASSLVGVARNACHASSVRPRPRPILTGDMINAQEAFRLGLANKVVPAGQVLAEDKGLAKKLAAKSKLTSEAALKAINEGLTMPPADGLRLEADQFGESDRQQRYEGGRQTRSWRTGSRSLRIVEGD